MEGGGDRPKLWRGRVASFDYPTGVCLPDFPGPCRAAGRAHRRTSAAVEAHGEAEKRRPNGLVFKCRLVRDGSANAARSTGTQLTASEAYQKPGRGVGWVDGAIGFLCLHFVWRNSLLRCVAGSIISKRYWYKLGRGFSALQPRVLRGSGSGVQTQPVPLATR